MAAPRQKLMKESATVVATTTFAAGNDRGAESDIEHEPYFTIKAVARTTAADLATRIAGVLRAQGYRALLVGGCVRDRLLGRPPKDYDIATDAHPDRILEIFRKAHGVGAHFGVVLVCEDDVCVE